MTALGLFALVIVSFTAGGFGAALLIDFALAVNVKLRDSLRTYLDECDEADGRAAISRERS